MKRKKKYLVFPSRSHKGVNPGSDKENDYDKTIKEMIKEKLDVLKSGNSSQVLLLILRGISWSVLIIFAIYGLINKLLK